MANAYRCVLAGGGGDSSGKTITPTDSVPIWLQCAGISDKSYTTISEVLNDSATLRALILNNNATDYMVRSTTWAVDICDDFTAMANIGSDNYCAETLLNDSTWKTAIFASDYIGSVLTAQVPIMTSDTAPYGQAIGTPANSETANYIVFTGKTNASAHTRHWYTADLIGAPCWIGYMFNRYCKVYLTKILWDDRLTEGTYVIQGSNDMVNWTNITSVINETSFGADFKSYECDTSQSFIYYRVNITSQASSAKYAGQMVALQFYGR